MTINVPWLYPIIMLIALISCSWLLRLNQKKLPLSTWQKLGLAYGGFCGAMIGAKLPFVIASDWESFRSGIAWFAHGKTIMTGLGGGYLGVEFAKWIFNVKSKTGDSFAVPVAVAIAIGRIGCFQAGCCFGVPSDLPWACSFELANDDEGLTRHPTQLYEFLFHALMALLLLWMHRHEFLKGSQFKFYLIAYASYRFLSEWIRPEPVFLIGFTFYQWCSLLMIAIFSVLLFLDRRKQEGPANPT